MKKLIYILFAALLGLVSCTIDGPDAPQLQNDGTVTLMMHVNFPEVLVSTKSTDMASTPNIDNIYVAVFGTNHYLNEYIKAVPCDADGHILTSYGSLANDSDFYFQVTLSATTSKRFVHVFANGPSSLDFDYEDNIMKELTTEDPAGSYWTYFVLPHGTASIAVDGTPSTLPEADSLFHNLKLIRNFARVSVVVDTSVHNFSLTGYKVYNTPTHGSVAVWSDYAAKDQDTTNTGYFRDYYQKDLDWLLDNYDPFMPNDEMNSDAPTDSTTYTDSNDKFIYERPDASTNRPYIMMQGRFLGDSQDTFYKLEFVDPDGNYFPIYRDQEYLITISAVARSGAAIPTEAKVANANVSSMAEAENLSDISDGLSRIYVQWLDKSYMKDTVYTFKYMYLPDASDKTSSTTAILEFLSGQEKAITGSLTDSGPGDDGWCTVSFNTTAPDDTVKITKFRVTGQHTSTTDGQVHKLYRDITVRVLPRQPWNSVNVTTGGADISDNVTVTITIPTGLPSSLFPLEIAFEDVNKCLDNAGTDMPAQVGETIIPGKSGSSYQFIKSVKYTEYSAANGNVITANFKRVRTGASTLYFQNEYFQTTGNSVAIPAN